MRLTIRRILSLLAVVECIAKLLTLLSTPAKQDVLMNAGAPRMLHAMTSEGDDMSSDDSCKACAIDPHIQLQYFHVVDVLEDLAPGKLQQSLAKSEVVRQCFADVDNAVRSAFLNKRANAAEITAALDSALSTFYRNPVASRDDPKKTIRSWEDLTGLLIRIATNKAKARMRTSLTIPESQLGGFLISDAVARPVREASRRPLLPPDAMPQFLELLGQVDARLRQQFEQAVADAHFGPLDMLILNMRLAGFTFPEIADEVSSQFSRDYKEDAARQRWNRISPVFDKISLNCPFKEQSGAGTSKESQTSAEQSKMRDDIEYCVNRLAEALVGKGKDFKRDYLIILRGKLSGIPSESIADELFKHCNLRRTPSVIDNIFEHQIYTTAMELLQDLQRS